MSTAKLEITKCPHGTGRYYCDLVLFRAGRQPLVAMLGMLGFDDAWALEAALRAGPVDSEHVAARRETSASQANAANISAVRTRQDAASTSLTPDP